MTEMMSGRDKAGRFLPKGQWFVAEIDSELQALLGRLARACTSNLKSAMVAIAESLVDVTEANFAAQGRPAWPPLKNPPPRRAGGMILQDTGALAASVSGTATNTTARVAASTAYAAIHQLGGKTSPHKIVPRYKRALAFNGIVRRSVNHPGSVIPARPYLPFSGGALQPEAREEVVETILRHLRQAAAG